MKLIIFVFCAVFGRGFGQYQPPASRRSASNVKGVLSTEELIEREGFSWENYEVTTQDGYILRLTRIVTGSGKKGVPVLMMHGLLVASDSWVVRGRQEDLAFLLVDKGFDVWMADGRGNVKTKRHKSLKPSSSKFWDFSFHEMGIYDLPVFIDKVLNVTGYSKLLYVGHSMGTTEFFIMNSLKPEYNDKIIRAALLAPVAWPKGCKPSELSSPLLRLLGYQRNNVYRTVVAASWFELLPRTQRTIRFIRNFCDKPPTIDFCLDLAGSFYGDNRANLNLVDTLFVTGCKDLLIPQHATPFKHSLIIDLKTDCVEPSCSNLNKNHSVVKETHVLMQKMRKLGEYLSYTPAGSSYKTVYHLAQAFFQNPQSAIRGFRQFDYGKKENLRRYNSTTPPPYPLSNIRVPMSLYYGRNDALVCVTSVEELGQLLPTATLHPVSDPNFTHIDFLIGTNAKQTVYNNVIREFLSSI